MNAHGTFDPGYPRDLIGYGRNPPHPRWPDGARIALQFVLNYEEGAENNVLHGDAAIAVEHERRGKAPNPGQCALDVRRGHDDGVINLVLGNEAPHDVGRLVLRNADDLQLVPILVLKGDQIRDLGFARRTPGCPEIDQRDLAAPRCRRDRLAVERLNGEARDRHGILVEAQRDLLCRNGLCAPAFRRRGDASLGGNVRAQQGQCRQREKASDRQSPVAHT